jgi:hypothetical protein
MNVSPIPPVLPPQLPESVAALSIEQELLPSISCSLTNEPLTNAVTLFPCCHKINEQMAKILYEDISNLQDHFCCCCEKKITAFAPDSETRTLAKLILDKELVFPSTASGTPAGISALVLQEFPEISCPVSLEPLTSAMSLVPCGHKVNENEAVAMFGAMTSEGAEKKDKECPLCRVTVTAYYPDPKFRCLAKTIFENGIIRKPKVVPPPIQPMSTSTPPLTEKKVDLVLPIKEEKPIPLPTILPQPPAIEKKEDPVGPIREDTIPRRRNSCRAFSCLIDPLRKLFSRSVNSKVFSLF